MKILKLLTKLHNESKVIEFHTEQELNFFGSFSTEDNLVEGFFKFKNFDTIFIVESLEYIVYFGGVWRLAAGKFRVVGHEEIEEQKPGYHLDTFPRGELGEITKIQEELDELKDAAKQKCKIMELVELSDLVGAMEAYLNKHHPSTSLEDLMVMSKITKRAFQNGKRG